MSFKLLLDGKDVEGGVINDKDVTVATGVHVDAAAAVGKGFRVFLFFWDRFYNVQGYLLQVRLWFFSLALNSLLYGHL